MVKMMKKIKYSCALFLVLGIVFCNIFSINVLAGGSHENYVYYHLGEDFRYVDTNSTPSNIALPRDTELSLGVRYEGNYISDLKVESESSDVLIGAIENTTMSIGNSTPSYCGVKLTFNGDEGSTVKLHMSYTITDEYDDPMDFAFDIVVTVTEKIKEHSYTKYVSNGNGTHKVVCEDCDAVLPEHESDSCVDGATICTSKATTSQNGKKETKCSICGGVTKTTTIYAAKTIKLSATTYTYDGKVKKPSVIIKDSKGNTISSTNYTVTVPSGRKNVGAYNVRVTFKGDYSGYKNLSFKISPPKTVLNKITLGKKTFTVKWSKKTTNVTGYEIQYSTSNTFRSGNKTVKVVSAKTTSKIIKNVKAKQKYYVRIRTYKMVGKIPYYSDWSSKKTVTT